MGRDRQQGASASVPSAVVLWRPIATAPRDGRTLLLCHDPFVPTTGHWTEFCEDDGGCWTTACPTDFESEDAFRDYLANTFYTPTHWSPLPLTPSELAQAMEAGAAETEGLRQDAPDQALFNDICDKMAEVVAPLPGANRQSAIAELCEGLGDARRALEEVLRYRRGEGKYRFANLPAFERECAAFDAWQEVEANVVTIATKLNTLLSKHSPDAPGQHAGTRATESGDGDEA